jgi:hypothetical protein
MLILYAEKIKKGTSKSDKSKTIFEDLFFMNGYFKYLIGGQIARFYKHTEIIPARQCESAECKLSFFLLYFLQLRLQRIQLYIINKMRKYRLYQPR